MSRKTLVFITRMIALASLLGTILLADIVVTNITMAGLFLALPAACFLTWFFFQLSGQLQPKKALKKAAVAHTFTKGDSNRLTGKLRTVNAGYAAYALAGNSHNTNRAA